MSHADTIFRNYATGITIIPYIGTIWKYGNIDLKTNVARIIWNSRDLSSLSLELFRQVYEVSHNLNKLYMLCHYSKTHNSEELHDVYNALFDQIDLSTYSVDKIKEALYINIPPISHTKLSTINYILLHF